MRRSCCILFLVLATGFLFSCEQKVQDKKFFDVPGYFKKEIKYIKQTFRAVTKTTIYNADSSITEFKVSDINWEKEFAIFLESDINKPIYYANLKTVPQPALDTNYHHLKYINIYPKANLQEVYIGFRELSSGDQAEFIMIKIKKLNLINVTNIVATYSKNNFYCIEGDQSLKHLGIPSTFFVKGVFN